jgi:short-subunit dehydrogenase
LNNLKVLITGGFGNIGLSALEELLKAGHEVTVFDLPTKANLIAYKKFKGKIRVVWGDLRKLEDLERAVRDQDVVVHLAFIIPKISRTGIDCNEQPGIAEEINVGGTSKLLQAMRMQPVPPKIIFTSSLHVYGYTDQLSPPRKVDDPVMPVEHYSRHKLTCEELVRNSGLTWSIFRLAAALPISLKLDPGMFDIPPWNRMEFVHTRDVGLAIARGVSSSQIWGKILHIGGGPSCQLYYRDIVNRVLGSLGIGSLPENAFSREPFATDWLDTSESQMILNFQTRTFEDYIKDLKKAFGFKRYLFRALAPIIKKFLLSRSPYYRVSRQGKLLEGKVALITGASRGIGREISLKLSQAGLEVILVSRNREALDSLAREIEGKGGKAHPYPCDLSLEEEREKLNLWVKEKFQGIDVLVNNAGFGWYGYLEDMPWDLAREMVELNSICPLHLIKLFLPQFKSRGSGYVINVSSIAGEIPSQGVALYSATKSFLSVLNSALYRELKGKVFFSSLKLGPVDTQFFEPERPKGSLRIPGKVFALRPERVASEVLKLLWRPRREVYYPRWMRVIPLLEFTFGWLFDALGPALLKRQFQKSARSSKVS